jgi:predicted ester cyclase
LPLLPGSAAFKRKIKDAIDDYVGFFNGRKWDQLALLIDESVQVNWNGELAKGKTALMADLKKYLTGIPDLTWQLDRNVVDGDRAAIAYTMQGKQTGNLEINGNSRPSEGKSIAVREAQYLQFNSEGRIISVITVSNSNDLKGYKE